jgi:molybdopterin-guanine dinucleotide biosynthesis protein A
MLVGSLILAGGRSRRMGKPKESLSIHDNSLLGRTVETLLDCTWPVVVIGRGGDQQLPPMPLEAKQIADEEPGQGPLAAMATGMRWVRQHGGLGDQDAVFVCGCDMPFLSSEGVSWLLRQLGDHQLVVARIDGILQPLGGVYRLDLLPTIERLRAEKVETPRTLVEKGRSRVLEEADLRKFDPELRLLRSVNTPAEYDAAVRAIGPP